MKDIYYTLNEFLKAPESSDAVPLIITLPIEHPKWNEPQNATEWGDYLAGNSDAVGLRIERNNKDVGLFFLSNIRSSLAHSLPIKLGMGKAAIFFTDDGGWRWARASMFAIVFFGKEYLQWEKWVKNKDGMWAFQPIGGGGSSILKLCSLLNGKFLVPANTSRFDEFMHSLPKYSGPLQSLSKLPLPPQFNLLDSWYLTGLLDVGGGFTFELDGENTAAFRVSFGIELFHIGAQEIGRAADKERLLNTLGVLFNPIERVEYSETRADEYGGKKEDACIKYCLSTSANISQILAHLDKFPPQTECFYYQYYYFRAAFVLTQQMNAKESEYTALQIEQLKNWALQLKQVKDKYNRRFNITDMEDEVAEIVDMFEPEWEEFDRKFGRVR